MAMLFAAQNLAFVPSVNRTTSGKCSAMNSADPSVDALSTKMISKSRTDCFRRDERHSSRNCLPFQLTTITLQRGIEDYCVSDLERLLLPLRRINARVCFETRRTCSRLLLITSSARRLRASSGSTPLQAELPSTQRHAAAKTNIVPRIMMTRRGGLDFFSGTLPGSSTFIVGIDFASSILASSYLWFSIRYTASAILFWR